MVTDHWRIEVSFSIQNLYVLLSTNCKQRKTLSWFGIWYCYMAWDCRIVEFVIRLNKKEKGLLTQYYKTEGSSHPTSSSAQTKRQKDSTNETIAIYVESSRVEVEMLKKTKPANVSDARVIFSLCYQSRLGQTSTVKAG